MTTNSSQLPKNLQNDCVRIGYAPLMSWIKDNEIELAKGDNHLNSLAKSVDEGIITLEQLNAAVAELDENSDKKIYLRKLVSITVILGQ